MTSMYRVWPSPLNEPFLKSDATPRRVSIADCTLRDGEQQPGLAFDRKGKLRIARALDELGVHEIEAGTPAIGPEDRLAVEDICRASLRARVSVLCRAITADVDLAVSLGVWGVRLSFPVSDIERKNKLKGINDEDYLARAVDICAYARAAGVQVIFSPYDTTRADVPFLARVVAELSRAGTVDRFRIVDTTGCALPQAIASLVRLVRDAGAGIPVEVHCHNDFGLACAATVAGVVAGAEFVSTTMNGLGERGGNAATEEVAMALEGLYGIDTGLRLSRLTDTSELVSEVSGVRPQPNKAVVGQNTFRHETGMVVAGVLNDPFTAEPYSPEIVGQTRRIVIGKTSGLSSVQFKAAELGLDVPQERLPGLLDEIKAWAVGHRRSLTDEEFAQLARGYGEKTS